MEWQCWVGSLNSYVSIAKDAIVQREILCEKCFGIYVFSIQSNSTYEIQRTDTKIHIHILHVYEFVYDV